MAEDDADDPGSTLIRTGKTALTFTEMATFVRELEARPGPRLLEDLPGLLALPEAKYGLVLMVLRKKIRRDGAMRETILERLKEIGTTADDPQVRERCQVVLARPE
jgi:hypothetical protein